jgi:hypothetical protein
MVLGLALGPKTCFGLVWGWAQKQVHWAENQGHIGPETEVIGPKQQDHWSLWEWQALGPQSPWPSPKPCRQACELCVKNLDCTVSFMSGEEACFGDGFGPVLGLFWDCFGDGTG